MMTIGKRPLQAKKGDVDARVHIFAATDQEEVDWLALRSVVFISGKAPVLIL